MINLDFLKKQHLSMFDTKRKAHKELVSTLYQKYISDKDIAEDKWLLFSGFYQYFSKNFPAEIYENEYIVGTNWHWKWQKEISEILTPFNGGHFIPDFCDFLEKGINGKINDVRKMPNSAVLETSLKTFSKYIKNYADCAKKSAKLSQGDDKERLFTIATDCEYISENPPASFRQALQLIWFIKCFLDTESGSAAISFGRADSYLYPYYKNDVENNILTPEEAKELIMCFYIKTSEGDESCMLTVGGDVENELTYMFVEAQTQINMRQPSIALRMSESTSDDLLNKATELVLNGSGMPAYFNDDVIVEGLKTCGIDDKIANDYGIVGCYEAAPQGVFSNTCAVDVKIYDSFDNFLMQKSDYLSFDDFLKAYKEFFENYYKNTLLPLFKRAADRGRNLVCPFASCVLNSDKYFFGINILEIGILIDSIYTIKKLVFDEKYTKIENLRTQAEFDFEDGSLYQKILDLSEHYGSNSPESNNLAKDITEFIGKIIQIYTVDDNVISMPALFSFGEDIWKRDKSGMINGRKKGELLSYGIMPCATPHKDALTSVLLSCANISAKYFPDGCPVMIRLNKKDVEKDGILIALIRTFFEAGGYHLAINTVDAKLLEQAKANPSDYTDIMVKISGFSAKFTALNEKLQDAIIERAKAE